MFARFSLSVRQSGFRVRAISPILIVVGIPHLVCGCILGWWSVACIFGVTVTLTSDLVSKIIVPMYHFNFSHYRHKNKPSQNNVLNANLIGLREFICVVSVAQSVSAFGC